MTFTRFSLSILSLLATAAGAAEDRAFDCRAFPADLDRAALVARHGAANVVDAAIPLGEGFEEMGTVLFPDAPDERVEILWYDATSKSRPSRIRVRGERSDWADPNGLTLGSDLLTIERVNRKPFRLLGFDWDYGGTQVSWAGGALDAAVGSRCHFRLRVQTGRLDGELLTLENQVNGEREFSSGHPAMQALNPRVYELWLEHRSVP